MKKMILNSLVFVLLLAIGYGVGTLSSCATATSPKKYEYRVVKINGDVTSSRSFPVIENLLNKMGASGWEMVGFCPANMPYGIILKR